MLSEKTKVLCVGLVCLDIIQECSSFPEEDSDQRCLSIRWQRGGNAANNCTVLSQIGVDCEFFGSLSSHNELSFIKRDFEDLGIGIDNCPMREACAGKSFLDSFPVSTVLINSMNGSRTIIHSKGDIPELSLENFKELNLSDYTWIHFEGRNIEAITTMMDFIRSWRDENGAVRSTLPTISVELEKPKPGLLSLAMHADIIFISKDFALFHGWNGMEAAIEGICKYVREGAIIVCTWGELGSSATCLASDAEGGEGRRVIAKEVFHSPAYPPLAVTDTLGAGDTFVAGFIQAFSAHIPLQRALTFASKLAGAKLPCKCPHIKSWRRNTLSDVPAVKNLCGHHTKEVFGNVNVAWLIERSYFSISQLDNDGKIISHVALLNYPNVSTVPPWNWMYWAKNLYSLSGMTNRNTMFIHHIAWDSKCSLIFLKPLIEIIFLNCVKIENVMLVIPPGVILSEIFDDCFMKLLPRNYEDSLNVQTVYYCLRERYFPKLTIRMAVEEDHDDVAPIINGQNSKLRMLYGEYFICDLVSQPDEERKILVAQDSQSAAGIMSLSTKIDTKRLVKHFELAAFNGLCKPDKEDKIASRPLKIVSSLKNTDPIADIGSIPLEYLSEAEDDEEEIFYNEPRVIQERKPASEDMVCMHDSRKPRRVASIYRELINEDLSAFMAHEYDAEESSKPFFELLEQKPDSARLIESEINLPTYMGKENAFCIELLAVDDKYDERQAEDFLQAAFEIFPDHEYCLISLPFNCPTFPLIKYFERAVPRCRRNFPHELFIMHRNSALSEIHVEHASQLDKDIIAFLSTIEFDEDIMMDFLATVTPEESHRKAFVVRSEGCVIGVVIIQEEEDAAYIRANYNIDKFLKFELIAPEEHGQIVHMALSPIFQRHSRYVMREVLTLTGMACFYYKLYPEWVKSKERQSNIMTAIPEMMPLYPRKTITHHLNSMNDICPKDDILKTQDPYALYMMTVKISSQLTLSVNTRMVVVGASEIAFSFLETLFFSATKELLMMNNVYLVSPYGLPTKSKNSVADQYFLDNKFYNPERLAKISLNTWLNLVLGSMTSIDREKKVITVNKDTYLKYDYLIIASDKKFHDMLEIPQDISMPRNHQLKRYINSFTAVSHSSILGLWEYLEKNVKENSSKKIIVHGHTLEAYIAIAALIESGYANSLILVEDFPQEGHILTCFNNDEVYDGVMSQISKSNVEILKGFHLESWHIDTAKNEIEAVIFTDNILHKKVDCLAFINYGKKYVDDTTFLGMATSEMGSYGGKEAYTISQAHLVFSKHIVIKPDFSTNDPYIYSAGAITRYAGRFYADEYMHHYYNAREVGKKMCDVIKPIWAPNFSNEKPIEIKDIIFSLKKPLVNTCKLPGGWNYLNVCKPGKQAPLNEAIHNINYGKVITTGNCLSEEMGYFRIHLNPWKIVETITCYTKKVIDVGNIVKLYGKHDRLLNNLTKRYEQGYIKNLYEHFSQPWITAIYYDRFANFHKNLLSTFKEIIESDENQLSEAIRNICKEQGYKEENEAIFRSLKKLFKPSLPRRKVELKVLEFLSRNRQYFPMYIQMSDIEGTMDERRGSPFHYTL